MERGRQKVLIVDDEKTNLKVMSQLLKEDVEVLLAKDGNQAIKKANQFKPDLILLDVVMPGMDGFEVLKQLKRDLITSAIPVIFVTALVDVDNEEKGLELGACDYIQKPFHMASVKARVRLHLQLSRQQKMLEQLANIDPLTSIANRRKYAEVFDTEWQVAIRNKSPMSLVMIDIDYFKKYNDHYGHAAGDRALKKVARVLSNQLRRPKDFIARYGGEEFVLILPDISYPGTIIVLEACCKAVEELQIEHVKLGVHQNLTISAGGYNCLPNSQDSQETALKMADDMLYRAKQQGRNCVACHQNDAAMSKEAAPE